MEEIKMTRSWIEGLLEHQKELLDAIEEHPLRSKGTLRLNIAIHTAVGYMKSAENLLR